MAVGDIILSAETDWNTYSSTSFCTTPHLFVYSISQCSCRLSVLSLDFLAARAQFVITYTLPFVSPLEELYANFISADTPSWVYKYPATRFYHIAHTLPSTAMNAAVQLAKQRNAGYVYFTEVRMLSAFLSCVCRNLR